MDYCRVCSLGLFLWVRSCNLPGREMEDDDIGLGRIASASFMLRQAGRASITLANDIQNCQSKLFYTEQNVLLPSVIFIFILQFMFRTRIQNTTSHICSAVRQGKFHSPLQPRTTTQTCNRNEVIHHLIFFTTSSSPPIFTVCIEWYLFIYLSP